MKNELMMAGLLTLTAGMVSQVVAPTYAQASAGRIENKLAKSFLVKVLTPARFTTTEGRVSIGHIYINVQQEKVVPGYPNLLKGEMKGYFYFESDENDYAYTNGEMTKTNFGIGSDGDVLLDMVNQSKENGNTYQIYTCSSTMSSCNQESYFLEVKGDKAAAYLTFEKDSSLELLVPKKNEKGETVQVWSKEAYGLETSITPFKN